MCQCKRWRGGSVLFSVFLGGLDVSAVNYGLNTLTAETQRTQKWRREFQIKTLRGVVQVKKKKKKKKAATLDIERQRPVPVSLPCLVQFLRGRPSQGVAGQNSHDCRGCNWLKMIGGAAGIRTPGLRIANAALCQLSYCPIKCRLGVLKAFHRSRNNIM